MNPRETNRSDVGAFRLENLSIAQLQQILATRFNFNVQLMYQREPNKEELLQKIMELYTAEQCNEMTDELSNLQW